MSICRDKQRSISAIAAANGSTAVKRKTRCGSADDVPTVSVSEPNLLVTGNGHKSTKSYSKHKATKQANENSNNSNTIAHNLRRSILSVSDTSLNKIPHKQSSASKPKLGSKEDIKVTSPVSPEQVYICTQLD